MAQFNRHRENAKIDPQYKDEPYKDRGYVAWNLTEELLELIGQLKAKTN